MLRGFLAKFLRKRAMESGKLAGMWRRFGNPSPEDWAQYLRRHGGFHSFGDDCYVLPDSVFTDPIYTSLGRNVWIAGAWISGHDGSVVMMGRAYGCKLDMVGPVIVKDDVFIGRGATILPGVTIGPRAIVGAGAVVSRDVPPNSVVAGNPARFIRTLDEHVARMKAKTDAFPWNDIIQRREGGHDPATEPELQRQRLAYFFGPDGEKRP